MDEKITHKHGVIFIFSLSIGQEVSFQHLDDVDAALDWCTEFLEEARGKKHYSDPLAVTVPLTGNLIRLLRLTLGIKDLCTTKIHPE
jgi:hypothetical protein